MYCPPGFIEVRMVLATALMVGGEGMKILCAELASLPHTGSNRFANTF